MTRYLILAAGVGYRWRDYLGIRKHQLDLDGERIIARTVRQLRDHGEVIVVGPDFDSYRIDGATLYTPERTDITGTQVDKFLSSRAVWNESDPTVFLWGDVWWSDAAIEKLVTQGGGDWHTWYRPGRSRITGTGNGEMFAHLFHPEQHGAEEDACRRIVRLHARKVVPWSNTGGWGHYRAMLGLPDEQVHGWHDGRNATLIDDWTDDFDQPLDYRAWYGRRAVGRYRVAAEPYAWDLPASEDPQAVIHGEGVLPDDSLWCAVAHAVEHGQQVIPYSHAEPKEAVAVGWEAKALDTADADARCIVCPAGEEPDPSKAIRLSGPLGI